MCEDIVNTFQQRKHQHSSLKNTAGFSVLGSSKVLPKPVFTFYMYNFSQIWVFLQLLKSNQGNVCIKLNTKSYHIYMVFFRVVLLHNILHQTTNKNEKFECDKNLHNQSFYHVCVKTTFFQIIRIIFQTDLLTDLFKGTMFHEQNLCWVGNLFQTQFLVWEMYNNATHVSMILFVHTWNIGKENQITGKLRLLENWHTYENYVSAYRFCNQSFVFLYLLTN